MLERPKGAEKYAVYTLEEVQIGLVRYIVHKYNQEEDNRTKKNRYQLWETGLLDELPVLPTERELDICLMKKATRGVQKGGHVSFDGIVYKGDYLSGYAGQQVVLRYDPDNLGIIYVYRNINNKEEFLTRAFPVLDGFENRSVGEWKALKKTMKKANKIVTSANISEFFEKKDSEPAKTLQQRREVAKKENKKPLTPIPEDLPEDSIEFNVSESSESEGNPLLGLKPFYENDLFE